MKEIGDNEILKICNAIKENHRDVQMAAASQLEALTQSGMSRVLCSLDKADARFLQTR